MSLPSLCRGLGAGAFALALLLAGCGGSDKDPAASTNTTPPTVATPATAAAKGRAATAYTIAGAADVDDPVLTTVCTVINGNSCLRIAFSRLHDYGDLTLETTRPVLEDLTAAALAAGYTERDDVQVADNGDTASYTIDQQAVVVRDMGGDIFVVAESDTLPVAQLEQRVAAAEKNDEIKLPLEWYLVGSGTVETGPDASYDYAVVTRSQTETVDECLTKTSLPVFPDLPEADCSPRLENDLDFNVATEDSPLFWGYAPLGTTLIHVIGDGVDTTAKPTQATLNGYPTFVVNIAPGDLDLPTFHAFDAEGNQLGVYPAGG